MQLNKYVNVRKPYHEVLCIASRLVQLHSVAGTCGMYNAVLWKATDAFRVNKYLSLHGQCNVLHFISITCSHHELCALCTVQSINYWLIFSQM